MQKDKFANEYVLNFELTKRKCSYNYSKYFLFQFVNN